MNGGVNESQAARSIRFVIHRHPPIHPPRANSTFTFLKNELILVGNSRWARGGIGRREGLR
ncbi:MAG: hypothetical protein ACREIC_25675, partial [Limisphaerales bacterium]